MTRVVALAGAALALSAALAAAAPPARDASTGSSAVLVRITIPGAQTVSLGELAWPTNTSAEVQSFQYPNDGSIVSLGRSRATVSAQPGQAAAAQAFAEVIVLSGTDLFLAFDGAKPGYRVADAAEIHIGAIVRAAMQDVS